MNSNRDGIHRPILSVAQLAAIYRVTEDRIREQYRDNATVLRTMERKARATGRKVGGYAADELAGHAAAFEAIANG